MIKLFDPDVTEDEVKAATQVIMSRNWASGAGLNRVREFEEMFTKYLSCRGVVAVNSGTAALHLALSLFNVTGKEVLVPSLSFVSTAHSVVYNGGIPVFVDIQEETLCMDPSDVRDKIRRDKTAAILPVHFGGFTCDMKRMMEISQEYGVGIVDDAAHACGSSYNGLRIGGIDNVMTCFSFHPVKNLSMPTGGAISLNHPSYEHFQKRLKSARWCGIDNRMGTSYDVTSITPNYYMNEISAAIGAVQLKKLERLNSRRKAIAKRYASEIKLGRKMQYSSDCVYHLYWILCEQRDKLIKDLFSKGIEVGTHYRPIHTMSAYQHFSRKPNLPVTNEIGNKIITLPIHPNLTDEEVSHIIGTVNSFGQI
jgi:perosamine synthetase